ncbi:MAG: hypothetical protein J6Y20_02530 [Lachnospiraceae bacterium]|nr:hypothetical protein [Lachnospiraceae bacterium]
MSDLRNNSFRAFHARHAALILLILGALLLCIDVRVKTDVQYPDYEFAENYGDVTQRMILEDVVGARLTLDVASEFLGYLFLLISLLIVWSYARPEVSKKSELKKLASKFGWLMPRVKLKYVALPAAGAALYALARLLPFYTNGIQLYGPEYFINFGLAIISGAALMFSTLCFLRECDRFQNHKETQLIYLFLFLTVFTGVVKDLAAFYGLNGVRLVYMVFNYAFVVVMCALLIHYVHIEDVVARQVAEETAEEAGEKVDEKNSEASEPNSHIYFKS